MLKKIVYLFKDISIVLIGWFSIVQGAYLENIPVNLHQPDGSELTFLTTGDEFYVRLHDANNYTIIQSQDDGYYYYAQLINYKVVPTIFRADQPLPSVNNLERGIQVTKEEYLQRRNNYNSHGRGRDAPTIGT
ncbi:uncharacterized protein METZ01_LOCUS512686, partial [marine metagenome]